MPDRQHRSKFETRDTEKMTPVDPIVRARPRSSPPCPIQDRFLQSLASKVERDATPRLGDDESE